MEYSQSKMRARARERSQHQKVEVGRRGSQGASLGEGGQGIRRGIRACVVARRREGSGGVGRCNVALHGEEDCVEEGGEDGGRYGKLFGDGFKPADVWLAHRR